MYFELVQPVITITTFNVEAFEITYCYKLLQNTHNLILK